MKITRGQLMLACSALIFFVFGVPFLADGSQRQGLATFFSRTGSWWLEWGGLQAEPTATPTALSPMTPVVAPSPAEAVLPPSGADVSSGALESSTSASLIGDAVLPTASKPATPLSDSAFPLPTPSPREPFYQGTEAAATVTQPVKKKAVKKKAKRKALVRKKPAARTSKAKKKATAKKSVRGEALPAIGGSALVGNVVSMTLKNGRRIEGVLVDQNSAAYTLQLPGLEPQTYSITDVQSVTAAN